MRTIITRPAVAAAALALAGAAAITVVDAPTAAAIPGWRRVYAAPASYCPELQTSYARKGFLTTGCHYYGSPSTGTGGWFEYHR